MERAAASLLLGFALGIASYALLLSSPVLPALALILCAAFALLHAVSRKEALYGLFALFFLGVVLGSGRAALSPLEPESLVRLFETRAELTGVIVADPDIRETTQRLVVETDEGKILAVAGRYPAFTYGETVRITGTLSRPEPFSTDQGRTFAYDRFLAKDGIFGIVERARVEPVAPREGLRLLPGFLYDLKNQGIGLLGQALPEPHASLAAGLVLGGKQGLGKELLDDFVTVGLVHIVVLSGYNVMIVAEFVMRLAGVLARRYAALAGGIAIALFVLAAGAGPASLRAGLMALIALYARATGRTYDAFRALLLAGFLMLLVSPYSLTDDPGFQLSFLATLGLIFGAPRLEKALSFIPSEFLRLIAASTIAAQVAVLPLLLYQNGLFSLVALPANLLVLPVVPLAMLASLFALLGPLPAFPAYLLLSYIVAITETAASLPLAAVSVPSFPFVFVVLAYGALAFLLLRSPAQGTASRPRAS